MILIFGLNADPHISSVTGHLLSGGFNFSVIEPFGRNDDGVSLVFSDDITIALGKNRVPLSGFETIWWRLKPRVVMPQTSADAMYDYFFEAKEWQHILDFVKLECSGIKCVNPIKSDAKARNKIYQLMLAKDQGFKIPKTLVSNDVEAISDFISSSRGAVFKTFTPYISPTGKVTYTTALSLLDVEKHRDSIRSGPGIIQELVKKKFELRITVVGEEVFAAKINSQYSESSKEDWRQDIFEDIYDIVYLDNGFIKKLLDLHKKFNLLYGAYDFIIDQHNEPIFLEVNPSGQWMWLENALGFQISRSLARLLSSSSCL